MHSPIKHTLRGSIFAAALMVCCASLSCSLVGVSDRSSNSLGRVRTLAGLNREFGEPFGIAARGNEIDVSDGEKGTVSTVGTDGSVNVIASGLNTPSAIAVTSKGEILVADTGSNTIKKIDRDGIVSLVAGRENQRGSADGDAMGATFNGPIGLAIGPDGSIFVADTYNDRIRRIKDGKVSTLSGGDQGFADGPGSLARFNTPLGIAIWNRDKLLVADASNGRVRVVEPDGFTWTLAGGEPGEPVDGPLGLVSFAFPTAITVSNGGVFIVDGSAVRAIGRRAFPIVETVAGGPRGLSDGVSTNARLNRPSGIVVLDDGSVAIADSDNGLVRTVSDREFGAEITADQKRALRYSASEFRTLQPPRWPYDPPSAKREIAGTLGEVRGEVSSAETACWFHNGLDIAGSYGEIARFVRSETILDPSTVQNFGGSRELVRMPTMGYIHIRLGRDQNDRPFNDDRFQFHRDNGGKPTGLRIPRGTHFSAGEAIGTLNALNHVHLIAGRNGAEMNALDALVLPGVSDSISPVIEDVLFFSENWRPITVENSSARIRLGGRTRVVVRAYDRVDGNAERRRLGVYRLGYQISRIGGATETDMIWTLNFARMPSNEAVRIAYANGSRSGPTGQTIFNYVVSNRVDGEEYSEGFLDSATLQPGAYDLKIVAADYFGNSAQRTVQIEITR